MTDEDRAYRGSRYSEVREGSLRESLSWRSQRTTTGTAPDVQIHHQKRVARHVRTDRAPEAGVRPNDRYQVRPALGADGKGLPADSRPNGICVLGTWRSQARTRIPGYFQKGAKGLTIGRFSSDGNETKRRPAALASAWG